jgi:N-acetylmuramoyl-L-alanine amidase
MKRFLLVFLFVPAALFAENVDAVSPEGILLEAAPEPVASAVAVSTEVVPLSVYLVHPKPGASLPAVKSSFVYGRAEAGGQVTVNGRPAYVHPGGGFLAMVDYTPGPNTLNVIYEKAGKTSILERMVTVGGGGGGAVPSMEALKPDQETVVTPGELVEVSFRAAAGGKGSFHVEGGRGKMSMDEVNGVYRGFFAPPPGESPSRAEVKMHYEPSSGKALTRTAGGRVTALSPEKPWVVEVSTDLAILRAGPGPGGKDKAGYVMFPPPGVRMRVTGRLGDELRVRLAEGQSAWIGRDDVKDLPAGTPIPSALTHGASVLPIGRHAMVRLSLTQKVPFEVIPSEDLRRVEVFFYGAFSNTDWIHLSASVPWVKEVRWHQDAPDVYRLIIETDRDSWWGYDARYEGGAFVLELRRPPVLTNPNNPLDGILIAVDAGHSADPGATGVTGTMEKDINRAIAECLKSKLEAERAQVVMIRPGDANVSLYDRPKLAWAARADLMVSVHTNALPEGDNPFEKRGYGVYYYQPTSLPLAREIHQAYGEVFDAGRNPMRAVLRNDGLHWGNLALPRTPQMPTVLTESAYLVHPDEEWWLRQPAFQCSCADAMLQGLKRYLKKMRPVR